jgi:hypothetical protein
LVLKLVDFYYVGTTPVVIGSTKDKRLYRYCTQKDAGHGQQKKTIVLGSAAEIRLAAMQAEWYCTVRVYSLYAGCDIEGRAEIVQWSWQMERSEI